MTDWPRNGPHAIRRYEDEHEAAAAAELGEESDDQRYQMPEGSEIESLRGGFCERRPYKVKYV